MPRAFVAIRPPDDVLDAIEARMQAFDMQGARRTTREQWHLTLQFLGDDCDVDRLIGALAPLEVAPQAIRLSGAGSLPPERRSTIFAMFVYEGGEWVRALADVIAGRLAPLGYERDDRPFTPHLTLARFRRPANLRAAGAAVDTEPVGEPWLVEEVVVYESRLGSGPARHIARAAIPLRAEPGAGAR